MSSFRIDEAKNMYPGTEEETIRGLAEAGNYWRIYKCANDFGDKVTHTDYCACSNPLEERSILGSPAVHNPVLVYDRGQILNLTSPDACGTAVTGDKGDTDGAPGHTADPGGDTDVSDTHSPIPPEGPMIEESVSASDDQPTTEDAVVSYNQATVHYAAGEFQEAERLFRKSLADRMTPALRKAAAAAAVMCQQQCGLSFSPEMLPADMREDANECMVAFLVINMAAIQLHQGRSPKVETDGTTWSVRVDCSGRKYKLNAINCFGSTLVQGFRLRAFGKPRYLRKSLFQRRSDAQMLSFLTKNTQLPSLEMAPLPANGLTDILATEESTQGTG